MIHRHYVALAACALAIGCASRAQIGFESADTPEVDAGAEVDAIAPPPPPGLFSDAGTPEAGAQSKKFFILVTETPAGSPPLSDWGGILKFDVADDFAPAVQGVAIPKGQVHDPLGLAFRNTSAEVFVGNRHGNNAADGTAGSISRFSYSAKTETFTFNGEITGAGMGAISQIAFNPKEDELFAANCCNGGVGISRFSFDAQGNATANGSIDTGAEPRILGVMVAPSGKRLYATSVFSGVVRQFELPSGNELAGFTIPGATRLHLMSLFDADLYIGDINGNVYHLSINKATDDLTLVDTIPADAPISVALSPSGLEMFATAHQFGSASIIDRFKAGSSWSPTTKVPTPMSLGGTLVFSAAAVPTPR